MSVSDPIHSYLELAGDLFEGRIAEADFPSVMSKFPLLNRDLLHQLSHHAENISPTRPRYGWAISMVAYSAAVTQNSGLFLQSLSAWYMARACNHWTQPKRVKEAISLARRGFEELNETGWLAACEWQLNALAWTKPNFAEATQTLKEALAGLEEACLIEFVPDCRLSLAYAQILIGEHEAALENIRISEETFLSRGDALNQARCWLTQASSLRRQAHFEAAFHKLEGALSVFERENTLVDQGKARYQMALGHLLKGDNMNGAVVQFTKAAELFDSAELDLWRAMCRNNLGSVYLFTGELALADQHYREAGETFVHHEVPGLLADNLNDQGEVNILRGRPQVSVEQFRQSIAINEKLGARLSTAVVATNLGKAYGQLGRYQDALFPLEQAADLLKSLDNHFRLGTCEKYAALIWSHLGQPVLTHEHLDRAIAYYELANHKAMSSEVHNIRATAFFQQGREVDAIECLQEALAVSLAHGVRPQAVLARRFLGEALVQTGRYEEALDHLKQAQTGFSDMGMSMELAATLAASGTCHALMSAQDRALNDFEEALRMSDGISPEVEWRAYIGLGNLAESHADIDHALQTYRSAMKAFSRIRQNFWQPALAGSYLQRPSRIFDGIISLASQARAAEDALKFIEQSRASTLLGQLWNDELSVQGSNSQELNDLESEILFLQNQLRTSLDDPLPIRAGSEYRQIRAKLGEKTKQYDALKARLERKASTGDVSVTSSYDGFDLSHLRELAERALGKKWVALDYYLLDDRLIVVVIDSERCEVLNVPIPYRFHTALDACKRAVQNPEPPTQGDLEILGLALIPAILAERLSPDTYLLLSPHKKLHTIPWSALHPQFSSKPLAQICIPVVVPSLQSLSVIWQRNKPITAGHEDGLVIGLSSFGGRRRELPHVKNEIAFLSSRLGPSGKCLSESDATWENMLKLHHGEEDGDDKGLSRFAWLHIASHFFSHPQTGRLSGLSLWDGDIWLDKLRDLSPLPRLVTLSACNSISSLVYEGEEHVDLPATCLAGGADIVVGSLWPVLDQSAAEFTSKFYSHYLDRMGPAEALVWTQRELMDRNAGISQWASFICIGAPDTK
jgi:tetratricopeptide (TPR) repeat protein